MGKYPPPASSIRSVASHHPTHRADDTRPAPSSGLRLLDLPLELVDQIVGYLDGRHSIFTLIQVCRWFYTRYEPVLCQHVSLNNHLHASWFSYGMLRDRKRTDWVRSITHAIRDLSDFYFPDPSLPPRGSLDRWNVPLASFNNLEALEVKAPSLRRDMQWSAEVSWQRQICWNEDLATVQRFVNRTSILAPPEERLPCKLTRLKLYGYRAELPLDKLSLSPRNDCILFLSQTLRDVTLISFNFHRLSEVAVLSLLGRHPDHATPLETLQLVNCAITPVCLRFVLSMPRALKKLSLANPSGYQCQDTLNKFFDMHAPQNIRRRVSWQEALEQQKESLEYLAFGNAHRSMENSTLRGLDLTGMEKLQTFEQI